MKKQVKDEETVINEALRRFNDEDLWALADKAMVTGHLNFRRKRWIRCAGF